MEFTHDETAPHELNLTAHRMPGASVWDRRGWDGTDELATTRWLIALGAGALALQGFRRRGFSGALFAGLGGSLVWWTMSRPENLANARRRIEQLMACGRHQADPVMEASAESFPASDAPAFTPTVGTGLRPAKPSGRRQVAEAKPTDH
jgi:hypothetical protein